MNRGPERVPIADRIRAGDFAAVEEAVGSILAPTFDTAFVMFGDVDAATNLTLETLVALVEAVRTGGVGGDDMSPLVGRTMVGAAFSSGRAAFSSGFDADDAPALGIDPKDARLAAIGRVAIEDRVALVLRFGLDLEPAALAFALAMPEAAATEGLARALRTVPAADPNSAMRDVFDARAGRVRIPSDLEDRILDRCEEKLR